MRCKGIYYTFLLMLILFLPSPNVASAGTFGETAEPVTGRQLASLSSSPSSAQRLFEQGAIRKEAVADTDKTSALRGEMPPKRLPLAPESLGLKLVGTVVAQDAEMNLAIIKHEGAGKQRIYYEGDRAGKALIKRILRNEVIIDAGKGDKRLTMLHGQAADTHPAPQQALSAPFAQQQAGSNRRLPGRHRTVRLDPEEVASALGDVNQVLREVDLSPVTSFDGPAGFRITNIPRGSILSQMALLDGDVIKAVDEEAVTGPEQAAKFLERVREGGQITVTVNKRRRTRRIHLEIR